MGHTIIPPRPSLVPIICENTDKQFTTLMGLSLRNVTLNLIQKKNGKVIYSELGEMLKLPPGTVRTRLLKIRTKLKDELLEE